MQTLALINFFTQNLGLFLSIVLGVATVAVPIAVPFIWVRINAQQRDQLKGVVEGLFVVVAEYSAHNPDSPAAYMAKILDLVRKEYGKLSPKQVVRVQGIVAALQSSPNKPYLAGVKGSDILAIEKL